MPPLLPLDPKPSKASRPNCYRTKSAFACVCSSLKTSCRKLRGPLTLRARNPVRPSSTGIKKAVHRLSSGAQVEARILLGSPTRLRIRHKGEIYDADSRHFYSLRRKHIQRWSRIRTLARRIKRLEADIYQRQGHISDLDQLANQAQQYGGTTWRYGCSVPHHAPAPGAIIIAGHQPSAPDRPDLGEKPTRDHDCHCEVAPAIGGRTGGVRSRPRPHATGSLLLPKALIAE